MSVLNPCSTSSGGHTAAPQQRQHHTQQHWGRPLAALFLAAAVAALAVAADRLMDSWADQHLLATWVALWAVVFAGSLLLAGTARRTAQRLMARLDRWARTQAQARAKARTMLLARNNPRLKAEWQASMESATDMGTQAHSPVQSVHDGAAAACPGADWVWSSAAVVEIAGQRRPIPYYI